MATKTRYTGYNQSKAPKSPDYSTPEKVTARAQEAAWDGGCIQGRCGGDCHWSEHVSMMRTLRATMRDGNKLYREFLVACRRPIQPDTAAPAPQRGA